MTDFLELAIKAGLATTCTEPARLGDPPSEPYLMCAACDEYSISEFGEERLRAFSRLVLEEAAAKLDSLFYYSASAVVRALADGATQEGAGD